jgi:two-component system, NarL family, invasion response regulator UvrY
MKILICDDHKVVREGIKSILKNYPAVVQIFEADNGPQLFDLLKKQIFDLVILDIMLPGQDGIEVLMEIKKISTKLPVLMVSAHEDTFHPVRSLKNGANGYLCKRLVYEDLILAITTIIGGNIYFPKVVVNNFQLQLNENDNNPPQELLTPKQYSIMIDYAKGKERKYIAAERNLKYSTITTNLNRVCFKLGLENISDIPHFCRINRLI